MMGETPYSSPTKPLAVIPWHPTQFTLKRASPSSAEPLSSRVSIIYLLFSWWFTKNIEKQINRTPNNTKTIFKNPLLESLSAAVDEDVDTKNSLYVTIVSKKFKIGKKMIEPLLCGIVLGLVPITLLGLFVSAWNQYRRGSGMLDID